MYKVYLKNYGVKLYTLFLLLIIFSGCSVTRERPETLKNSNNLNVLQNNVSAFNGTYSVFANDIVNDAKPYLNNANEKFYRKYGVNVEDTIRFDSNSGGSFKITMLDNQKFKIDFIKDSSILKSQILNYHLKNDGFLYSSNNLIKGIPLLFGGVDAKIIKIGLNTKNDLIITDMKITTRSILIIFTNTSIREHVNNYSRKE